MKSKLRKALPLYIFVGFTAFAGDTSYVSNTFPPPDKEKVSYALGMQAALQSTRAGVGVDAGEFVQAVKDVFEGKPTRLEESEMAKILNQGRTDGGLAKQAATDKGKVSYALGMRLGMQLKRDGADVNADTMRQAIKDVEEGKATRVQESEIEPLFIQAEAYDKAALADKNKSTGDSFLAKNAKEPGVVVLPDSLQYRVLKTGAGEIPGTNDLIFVKYRGTFIDGKEFDHHDRFLTRSDGGLKGWQEALQRMKIGSKWQLFVPAELAFGHAGENYKHVGPDTTVVYELELLSVATGNDLQVNSGVGHGLDVGVAKPEPAK